MISPHSMSLNTIPMLMNPKLDLMPSLSICTYSYPAANLTSSFGCLIGMWSLTRIKQNTWFHPLFPSHLLLSQYMASLFTWSLSSKPLESFLTLSLSYTSHATHRQGLLAMLLKFFPDHTVVRPIPALLHKHDFSLWWQPCLHSILLQSVLYMQPE